MNPKKWEQQISVRALENGDYDQWSKLRDFYYEELGFPNTLNKVEQMTDHISKVEMGITWGFFKGETLTSIADLNAYIPPFGQLGGVFTHPKFRRQGMSKKVMQQVFYDCHTNLEVERLTIFTGSHNVEAQNLYTSLGAQQKGHFALLFGR